MISLDANPLEARHSAHLASEALPQFLASHRAKSGQPFRLWCTGPQGEAAAQNLALLLQTALRGRAPFRILATMTSKGPGDPQVSSRRFNAIYCPELFCNLETGARDAALSLLSGRLLAGGHLYAPLPEGVDVIKHGLRPLGSGVHHKIPLPGYHPWAG